MPQITLHPSWPTGDEFPSLWKPPRGSARYILCSCWTTVQGWKSLVVALKAHARATPGFLASLYFDLACTKEEVWPLWQDFIAAQPAWCALYIVDGSPLFHAKVVAARGPEGVHVFIGSANLTKAGLHSNFEIMAGVHHDPATFDALEAALADLGERVTRLRSAEDVAAAAKRAEHKRRATAASLEDESPGVHLEGPAREVAELLTDGVFVYRSEGEVHLTVSVSMDAYRKAGVLRPLRSNTLATGITWGDRADTMSISLVPDDIEKLCREVRKKCGQIVARLALPAAGRLWMPHAWAAAFRDRWKRAAFQKQEVHRQVRQHVAGLMRQIQKRQLLSEKREQLYQILDVQPVSSWEVTSISSQVEQSDRLATLHLMGESIWAAVTAKPPSNRVSDALRAEVVEGVMEYISRMTSSRLNPEFPLLQIEALRTPPTLAPIGGIGPAELVQVMAEWARRAAAPHLRHAVGQAPTNGVAAVLYRCLQQNTGDKFDPARVYARAIEWQAKLSEHCGRGGPTIAGSVEKLVNDAAAEFQGWFGGLDWGDPPEEDDGAVHEDGRGQLSLGPRGASAPRRSTMLLPIDAGADPDEN